MITVEQYIEAVREERAAQHKVWDANARLRDAREAEQKARNDLEWARNHIRGLWESMDEATRAEIRNREEW